MINPVDLALLLLYFAAMAAIGISLRGPQNRTSDYYISKGTLPGWLGSSVVGLSIAATYFSGISFLAYPSVVLQHGLVIFATIFTLPLQYFLVVRFFVPRFTRKEWGAPYEILEERFGVAVRRMTSLLYILMRMGWMGALIYAPSIAILGALGLGDSYFWPVVALIGLTSSVYSALGGLRGIMVTDAIQMLIIICGCIGTVGFILFHMPVPLGEAVDLLAQEGTLRLLNFSTDLSVPITTWSALIGGFLSMGAMYLGDQMSLQRYMASSTLREVRHSFLINALSVAAILLLLAGIGVCLGAWSIFQDQVPMDTDQVFLRYVATQLPMGLAGLMVAALLAATMSSMTSGINALSAAIEMDFSPRFLKFQSEEAKLRAARVLSFGIGIGATLSAGLVANLGQIFEIAQRLLGVFAGPIAVVVVFAVLPFRIKPAFLITGQALGLLAGGLAAMSPHINGAWPEFPLIGAMWTAPVAILTSTLVCLIGARRIYPISNPSQ